MKRITAVCLGWTLLMGACAPTPPAAPRLVVVLVVDQMRGDYLNRFNVLLEGGLRRLVDQGQWFQEAYFGAAMTGTAPGHATIATGQDPREHGVFEQSWFDRDSNEVVRWTDDPRYPVLNDPDSGASPFRLRKETVGDWLKKASPQSHVVSLAIKARSAIALGGHSADAAFWFHPDVPGAVTSTYYLPELPAWVAPFNEKVLFQYEGQSWEPMHAESRNAETRQDGFDTENGGVDVSFTHHFDENYFRQITFSPLGDHLTLQFATLAIDNMELGQDDTADLLWIGLSSADLIGHLYGPYSQEVEDYYTRLDAYLGEFFDGLDARIGKDQYSVVLTSDHGVAPLPEYAQFQGVPAKRIVSDDYQAFISSCDRNLGQEFEVGRACFRHATFEGIVLDYETATSAGIDSTAFEMACKQELEALPFVAAAYTRSELLSRRQPGEDPYLDAYRRTWPADRGPDILLRWPPYWLVDTFPGGTNHGTPYNYDTHVPLLVMSSQVEAGSSVERLDMRAVAPTIAKLLGVASPADVPAAAPLAIHQQP